MENEDIKENKINTLEMLGKKEIEDGYNYYLQNDKEKILSDIENSLNDFGIQKDDPNYNKLIDNYKNSALEMKDKVSNMTKEEFFGEEYSKLNDTFGFNDKGTIRESYCTYDSATIEEAQKIIEDKGIIGNALRDLKNFVTMKNPSGKLFMSALLLQTIIGTSIALAYHQDLWPLDCAAFLGTGGCFTYFLGSVAKNIRRKIMPETILTRAADKIDDYMDEPVKHNNDNGYKYMSEEEENYIRRL